MKNVLLIILLTVNFNVTVEFKTAKTLSKIKTITAIPEVKLKAYHKIKYNELIEFIKLHEGFRATPYNDAGYPAIGYGQRLKFFTNFKIKNKITKQEADKILRISFNNHIRGVDYYYPGLTELQRYAVAHISYSIGLGNAQKFGYFYKKDGRWHINKHKLLNSRKVDRERKNYRDNRIYEYNLFYRI